MKKLLILAVLACFVAHITSNYGMDRCASDEDMHAVDRQVSNLEIEVQQLHAKLDAAIAQTEAINRLLSKNLGQQKLIACQPQSVTPPVLDVRAHLKEAQTYMSPNQSNFSKALDHLDKAAKQTHDLWAKAMAQLMLGELYCSAPEKQRSCGLAIFFLEDAVKQNHNPEARIKAAFRLGEIYCTGYPTLPKDFSKALTLFKVAIDQTDDPYIRAQALLSFGCAYFFGDTTLKKNFSCAIPALQAAAQQTHNTDARIKALLKLGQINCIGDWSVSVDYTKALFNFNDAARLTPDEGIKQIARDLVSAIISEPIKKITQLARKIDENIAQNKE